MRFVETVCDSTSTLRDENNFATQPLSTTNLNVCHYNVILINLTNVGL